MIRLFLLSPTTVFAARVNLPAGATYPLDQIPFDGVTTGAYTSVAVGQTILLGSAAGLDDYGRGRVRKAPTSSILYVGRSSQGSRDGEFIANDNAYITVLNDYRVWARIPYIDQDGVVFKDSDIAFTDQTLNPPPVANTGPGFAATIDSISGLITAQFVGTASFATASGATISTYLWNVSDGTITVGTSASSTITVTFPAGFRWIGLTVTDSNGKVHTSRCPVYARNPAADTTVQNFQITSHRITQAGQQVSVKVLSDIPVATYPDNTLAILFENEPASPSDRSNLIGVFWHHTDPATITAQRTGTLKDTTLELLDVAGKLDALPGFPQSIEYNATPTSWLQMKAACIDRYLWYLLYWHSTALDLADFTWSGTGNTYAFVVLSSDGASLWQQVARRAKSIVPNYVLTCNTLGQIRILPDPLLLDTGSRTATVQAALTASNWSNLRFTHHRPARAHWLRANAIIASSTDINAVFCIAPGETPAQGESAIEQGEQLAVSQAALNAQEGHRYARLNAPEDAFDITLTGGSDLGIEPANMTWVTLTLPASVAAQRGLNFSTARGLPLDLSIRYEYGRTGLVRSVDLSWERETVGIAAVTEVKPDISVPTPEREVSPDNYDPTPPPINPTGLGLKTVYVMLGNFLYRTRNFDASPPVWVSIGPTASWSYTPQFRDFILDPWLPNSVGYLSTIDGVYKSTNLDTVTPTWSVVLSAAQILAATADELTSFYASKLIGTPDIQNTICYFYETDLGAKQWIAKTSNGGTTWSHTEIIATPSISPSQAGATDIVPHLVGGQMVIYQASKQGDILLKSINSGSSWVTAGAFPDDITNPHVVHCPYEGNQDGQTVYIGFVISGGFSPVGRIYKSTDGGATFNNVSPIADRGSGVYRTGIESSPLDSNYLYAWVEGFHAAADTLWVSEDGAATWSSRAATGYSAANRPYATSGFPYDKGKFYVVSDDGIYLSTDGGATFVDKTGALSVVTWDVNFLNGYAAAVIVPLWTE